MDASEIYSKRLNAKEVLFPKEKGECIFQSQMDESKPLEEIRTCEHPPWCGIDQFKERVILTFLENQKGLFHHLKTRFRMPAKRLMIFGPCQETSYTAITLNPESNFTRREQSHSLFHRSTLTFPELHTQIWRLSRKNASTITGISMDLETCQILGQVSHNLLCIYVVRGEIDEETAYIQATSFMARNLENNGKECQAEGEAKVVA